MKDVLKDRVALVTGASSGIGAEIARQLSARGANLVLTARREDRLAALADDIRRDYGTEASTLSVDLTAPNAAKALFDATEGRGQAVDILVNCAGFGFFDDFVAIDWDDHAKMLQVNVTALTELTHRFANAMKARRNGRIMNVASTAAFGPCPDFASYAASKAYVRNFTEALDYELQGTGVRAIVVSPGGTRTEFQQVGGQTVKPSGEMAMMSGAQCAEIAVKSMLAGRRTVVTGKMNAFSVWLLRFVPRRWLPAVIALTMKGAFGKGPRLIAQTRES